jgi:hypothetical protein
VTVQADQQPKGKDIFQLTVKALLVYAVFKYCNSVPAYKNGYAFLKYIKDMSIVKYARGRMNKYVHCTGPTLQSYMPTT